MYKLVAKVLAARLTSVMDKLFSPNQLAFHKGRFLVDRVVDVNEVVDFEKAYDNMLLKFGFYDKWHNLIWASIFYGNLYVLINWCLTQALLRSPRLKILGLLSICPSFEFVFSLCVNFAKNRIICVIVGSFFLFGRIFASLIKRVPPLEK